MYTLVIHRWDELSGDDSDNDSSSSSEDEKPADKPVDAPQAEQKA